VLIDGGRPLTVTKKVKAKQVPADVRVAVKARDRGDRFPGSRRRIGHLHHLDKDGAGHHPDMLIGLAGPSHRRVHRFGWSISINADNGEATFTWGERSWTTLPQGTQLRRPPHDPADPTPARLHNQHPNRRMPTSTRRFTTPPTNR
jgi:hypothetical protein